MNKKIKAIIFDYGGTLDTNGIHWSVQFRKAYKRFNIDIHENEFRKAFIYSERKIPEIIKNNFSLSDTYRIQITYQLEYLINNKIITAEVKELTSKLSNYCYETVTGNISQAETVLNELQTGYSLGLVSNYYGNVKTVLTELGLVKYFNVITDSAIVGIRKPDKKIFIKTMEKLKVLPSEVIVVGDSYKNDIAPSKAMGCKTVWLKVQGWQDEAKINNSDATIKNLKELTNAIKHIIKN